MKDISWVKTKTIAKWLLIGVGTIVLALSFTAQWIGLDPNNGWGPDGRLFW